ncbi:DNA repair protein RecO [Fusobacterium sp. PH5-44]|uniref:DNA repair protein RecO n=1 Tax=unclassified Fusobacterium TaxID=2648384 RepID=UPI003D21DA1B
MNYINCYGLVINSLSYGESDKKIDIFTRDYGKISTSIHGIRKSKRREQASTDIMTLSKFIFYKKEENYVTSDFSVIEAFTKLKCDMENIDIALSIINVLNKLLVYSEPKENLYDVTIKILKILENNKNIKRKYMLLTYFLLFIIKKEGVLFDIDSILVDFIPEKNNFKIENILKIIYENNKKEIDEVISDKSNYTSEEILKVIFLLEKYIKKHLGVYLKLNNCLMGGIND